jgi:hypothetical protein
MALNTEGIEEAHLLAPETATETTTQAHTENEVLSLHERLAAVTENKAPGSTAQSETVKSFWQKSDEDFEAEIKQPEAPPANTPEKPQTKAEAAKSDKIRHAEADMAVGMLNMVTTGLFIPAQNFKLKRKLNKTFTPEQLKTVSNFEQYEIEEIDGINEKRLKKIFDNMQKKYNKKIEQVPLTMDEKAQFHEACYNYMEITGKSLPPGLFLGLSALQIVGNRVIDVATD